MKAILLMLGIILMTGFVMAQTIENLAIINVAGTTPDSPFYFIDLTFDRLTIFLAFNPLEKTKAIFKVARERQMESIIMANSNNERGRIIAINHAETNFLEIKEIELGIKENLERGLISNEEADQSLGEINKERAKAIIILENLVERIEDDTNLNNDKALIGLNNALEKVEEDFESTNKEIVPVKISEVKKDLESEIKSGVEKSIDVREFGIER